MLRMLRIAVVSMLLLPVDANAYREDSCKQSAELCCCKLASGLQCCGSAGACGTGVVPGCDCTGSG